MSNRANRFIDVILGHEGGYQNNPNDSGNYHNGVLVGTNYGISAPVLAAYRNRNITAQEMRDLSREEAKKIYISRYYNVGGYDHYKNESTALLVFDAHVNQGRGATIKILNRAYEKLTGKTFPESVMSKEGIEKLNTVPEKKFFDSIYLQRKSHYENGNPNFVRGWLNRLETFSFKASSNVSTFTHQAEQIFVPQKENPSSFFPLIGLSLLSIGVLMVLINKMK